MVTRRKFVHFLVFVFLAVLLAACNFGAPAPVQDPGAVFTQAAMTVVAGLTQTAQAPNPNAVFTQVAATVMAQGTQLAQLTTSTPTPTNTLPPTNTSVPATATNTQIPNTPTATIDPTPCDAAAFVADVTVPDGTLLPPNSNFTKIWRLRNVGRCTWDRDYSLVYAGGERMGAQRVIPLNSTVRPGETLEVAVNFVAPDTAGTYRSNWMLENENGDEFGIGNSASGAFWVQIKVFEPNEDYAFDFVTGMCLGRWSSDTSDELPCPGVDGDDDGYVQALDNPALENGRLENEPALLTVPNDDDDGYIRGVFRNIRIRDDYRFLSGLGCLDDSNRCDVIFRIQYRTSSGQITDLGAWQETYDGKITVVEIDLSFLEGETVDFILTVDANGDIRGDNAIWWVPRIERN